MSETKDTEENPIDALTSSRARAASQRNHHTVKTAAHRAHRMVDEAADAATSALDRVTDTTTKIRTAPQQLTYSVESAVRKQPWRALGIALAVGFLVGRLSST